jgi:hypothetical protein
MPNDAVLIDAILALNPGVACEVAEGDRCVTWSMWTAHDPDVFLESISGHRLNAFKDDETPRVTVLTCGFVVARGGVEPPTFRFSGRKCPSGEVVQGRFRA